MTRCPLCPAPGPELTPVGTWWRCGTCERRYMLPQPGFQRAFVSSGADILLAASGAGVGKTAALLMAAARWIHITGYRALLLRQMETDLSKVDGLIDQARAMYEPIGGLWYAADQTFRFETADGESSIQLGHVGKDYRSRFQGPQMAFLGIDELTQVDRAAFRWFFSRLRSSTSAPVRVRATCNPDGDSWVYEDLAKWWIGVGETPDPDRLQRRRYLAGRDGQWFWGDSKEEVCQRTGRPARDVLSMAFMTATLGDNRYLANQGYEGRLGLLEAEDAASLHANRWIRRVKGKMLKPDWLSRELEAAPEGTRWVRAWDLAATAEDEAYSSTSYSAGVLVGLAPDGRIIIGDAEIGRWGPAEVDRRVLDTAKADGKRIPIRICREWAGAGKAYGDHLIRLLVGWDVEAETETGDKGVRLRPFASQAEAGNVYLVRGPWTSTYRAHMLALTTDGKGRPNDAGDATARGLDALTDGDLVRPEEIVKDIAVAREISRTLYPEESVADLWRPSYDPDRI